MEKRNDLKVRLGFAIALIIGIYLILAGFFTAVRIVGTKTFVLQGTLMALAGVIILIVGIIWRAKSRKKRK